MKLLCCIKCNQVFNLWFDYQECRGGHGGGQYVDRLNAKVWGNPKEIFILGFTNNSFISALRHQMVLGDLPAEDMPSYGMTPPGREFTAFVIPDAATSIVRVEERFEPIEPAILAQTRSK